MVSSASHDDSDDVDIPEVIVPVDGLELGSQVTVQVRTLCTVTVCVCV